MKASATTIKKRYLRRLKSVYCTACLSSGRKLSRLGELSEIYHELCRNYATVMHSQIQLCFECLALLRNVIKFQEKVKNSHEILKNHIKNKKKEIKSRSSLMAIQPVILSTVDDFDDNKSESYEVEVKEEFEEEDYSSFNDEVECEPLDDIKEEPYQTKEENEDKLNTSDLKSQIDSNSIDMSNSIEDHSTERHENIATDNIKEKSLKQESKSTRKGNSKLKLNGVLKMARKKNRTKIYRIIDKINIRKSYTHIPVQYEEVHHWLERERNSEYFKKIEYKCEKCVTKIKSKEASSHNRCHLRKTKYKCYFCELTFKTRSYISRHLKSHGHIRSCNYCDYKCVNLGNIYEHIAKEHVKRVECLKCDDCFQSKKEFQEHFKEVHNTPPTFVCDHCGTTVGNKRILRKHISRHTVHECKECNKTFASKESKHSHMELKHRIEPSEATYCVTCDKQFDNMLQFKLHIQNNKVHNGEHKYAERARHPCPACERTFMKKCRMKSHHDLVHLNIVKYYCSTCNKGFSKKAALRRHYTYTKAHENLERPKNKICNICGRGFSNNNILRHHIRTHTGERPHACPHCDSTFAQKVAMVMHIRNIHKKKEHEKNMDE